MPVVDGYEFVRQLRLDPMTSAIHDCRAERGTVTVNDPDRRRFGAGHPDVHDFLIEAVGRLAGGIAHDFNNLLTAILGYCGLLLDDRHCHDIGEIQKVGLRAAALTRQLLAFSRKEIIAPTTLDLNAVVAEMRVMLDRLIREDVKIMVGLRPNLALVTADRGQVEQIVVNLAVNARDAMPKGGTLTIETANVELDKHYALAHSAVTPGPHVCLAITDTGIGMTPEVRARIFEPFLTTKSRGRGTGLGLASVQGTVARSGGSIAVDSEPGRGSAVKVYFPRADATALAPQPTPAVAAKLASTEIVVVVEDADEAKALFSEHATIDLLLTDVVMPGASGPQLTRELIVDRPLLKVIYRSGYTEHTIVQHGVLLPGIAFLSKPFTAETLGRKIRSVLGQ